jgi:lysine 6-dehydrogenase
MKIMVLGSGLMGPAAAYQAMVTPDVARVALCDLNQGQLDAAYTRLSGMRGGDKLTVVAQDVYDEAATAKLMAEYDAIVAALPIPAIHAGMRAAALAKAPLVDLNWPLPAHVDDVRRFVDDSGGLVLPGCGLEPGLTEIMARHLAEKLDQVHELHIKCGGIPERPTPPLGYKIVFGGRNLPLRESDALICQDGELRPVPRYSGVHPVHFPGVGDCEAWHEGFMPQLMELDALEGLSLGTQTTVRWPGYAEKVTLLREMGLLSEKPIQVDGAQVSPKALVDALLYPHVKLEEGEVDITCFRVEAVGEKKGHPRRYRIEMVDRYDEKLGSTSMARTTAMTAAIVACMIARGELKARGFVTPEQVITGPLLDKLVAELAAIDIRFDLTTEKTKTLH